MSKTASDQLSAGTISLSSLGPRVNFRRALTDACPLSHGKDP